MRFPACCLVSDVACVRWFSDSAIVAAKSEYKQLSAGREHFGNANLRFSKLDCNSIMAIVFALQLFASCDIYAAHVLVVVIVVDFIVGSKIPC